MIPFHTLSQRHLVFAYCAVFPPGLKPLDYWVSSRTS